MSKRTLIWGGIIALALIVGVVTYVALSAPPRVEVVDAEPRDVVEYLAVTGTLRGSPEALLSTDISGTVATVSAREGERVDAGALLLTLSARDAELSVARARAALTRAEAEMARTMEGPSAADLGALSAELDSAREAVSQARRERSRARKLKAKGLKTEAVVEQAETAYDQAKANVKRVQARIDAMHEHPRPVDVRVAQAGVDEARVALEIAEAALADTRIVSPFAGLVIRLEVAPGETVTPGQGLIEIANLDDAYVEVETDEDHLARLRVGQAAELYFPSAPGQRFPATVAQIGPEIDTRRGVVRVRLTPRDLPEKVFPGVTVDVNIELETHTDALSVPLTSLLDASGESFVLRIEDGLAVRAPVKVLGRGLDFAAVEGLEPGAGVLLRATEVQEGDAVERARGSE